VDIPEENILYTVNRYISNGTVSDITHIVYVDPERYAEIADYQTMLEVGRAVSRLNKILPKRQFILMGPGRWGSRGDQKLGVSVTYSDINNSSMLIELACERGDYIPEPSFGTHFFQDLVEAAIRYLPIYPGDAGVIFNEAFFRSADSRLEELLPEFQGISDVIRVIDVPETTGGLYLQVRMNSEEGVAIGFLAEPVGVFPDSERER
jgi:hypothetical protein